MIRKQMSYITGGNQSHWNVSAAIILLQPRSCAIWHRLTILPWLLMYADINGKYLYICYFCVYKNNRYLAAASWLNVDLNRYMLGYPIIIWKI